MNIGFFDSGIGGLSIFKHAIKDISANFIYYADNQNAPYGTKDISSVQEYSLQAASRLIEHGCKIIVVACNTATSVAIDKLRQKYKDIIFIGTEPAIKVASDDNTHKKIIVCATTITVNGKKLYELEKKLNIVEQVDNIALDKLVCFAESDNCDYNLVKEYIMEKMKKYNFNEYSHIVLGCTHFPFFLEEFRNIIPENVSIVDSTEGVLNNLKQHLKFYSNSNNSKKTRGNIKLIMSKYDNNFINRFKNIINNKSIKIDVI